MYFDDDGEVMRLVGLIRNALGKSRIPKPTVIEPPVFQILEPRVLLSADGLATIQLDSFDSHSGSIPAIEIDQISISPEETGGIVLYIKGDFIMPDLGNPAQEELAYD